MWALGRVLQAEHRLILTGSCLFMADITPHGDKLALGVMRQ